MHRGVGPGLTGQQRRNRVSGPWLGGFVDRKIVIVGNVASA